MLDTILAISKFLIANASTERELITGALDVYRLVRDEIAGADAAQDQPAALTDAELAQLVKDAGLSIVVESDHWLAQYGFAA